MKKRRRKKKREREGGKERKRLRDGGKTKDMEKLLKKCQRINYPTYRRAKIRITCDHQKPCKRVSGVKHFML